MTSAFARAARSLLEQQQHGTLCTAHATLGGWPFGSITPYSVLGSGDPVVFLSDIAEHTHNLARDARASLFVADPAAAARPQAGARAALLVRARHAHAAELAAAESSYFDRFPQARAMREAHGFHLFVLEVDCVRWIAGFGEMGWVSREHWSGQRDPLAAHAAGIADHLNADHADAVRELVRHVCGVASASATVLDVDRGGLLVRVAVDERTDTVRVPFDRVADDADGVRQVVVTMLHDARRAHPA